MRDQIAGRKSFTVKEIRSALTDMTYLSYSGIHGTQVEYASKDGRVFLWYPGNKVILAGKWEPKQIFVEYYEQGNLIKRFEFSQICFQYGDNTYNPATGHAGGGFECQSFAPFRERMDEGRRGDVFRLRGRIAVPFALTKERTSLEALRAKMRS